MIFKERSSMDITTTYWKKKYLKKSNCYYLEKKLLRSKSETFFSTQSFSTVTAFSYLPSSKLKSAPKIFYKIPFIDFCQNHNKLNRSQSYINLARIKSMKNKEDFQKRCSNGSTGNFDNSFSILHKSQSSINLNTIPNIQHNLYFIHGRIPHFTKILHLINYNQHISRSGQANLSSSIDSLSDFFKRDERVSEREHEYIKAHTKITFFSRCRNNSPKLKKKKSPITATSPQKEKPRFNIYFPSNSTPPTKKTNALPNPPRLSPAYILNEKYNIRTRLFKENNIRKFYKELAIAEEEDKHFIFNIDTGQKISKRKRSKSTLNFDLQLSYSKQKQKRSKSVEKSLANKKVYSSTSPSPKAPISKPRFKLYSPKKSSSQFSKQIVQQSQPPKPSPASVLNEKYNIRTRLFKEMNVHDFYHNLAEAEEDAKLQKSLKQIQLSSRSKKIVNEYIQNTDEDNKKNTLFEYFQSENINQRKSPKRNLKQTKSEAGSRTKSEAGSQTKSEAGSQTKSEAGSQTKSDNDSLHNAEILGLKNSQSRSQSQSSDRNESQNESETINSKDKSVEPKEDIKSDSGKANSRYSSKEEESASPPKIKKFAKKVPGFISEVSNFLKEYDINVRKESSQRSSKLNSKKKKKSKS